MKKILIALVITVAFFGFLSMTLAGDTSEISNQSTSHVLPYSIGSSTITLNTTSITVEKGSTYKVSYTVKLTSGTKWGTYVGTSQPSGISVSTSTGIQDPTFSGTASISPSTSMAIGTYTVSFSASGDDPTSSSTALTVHVINGTSASSPPSSSTTPTSSNNDPYIIGSVVILLFLVSMAVTSVKSGKIASSLNIGSSVVAIVTSLYLLSYDTILMHSAYAHWLGLLIFVILAIVALLVSHINTKVSKYGFLGLGAGSLLFAILMLSDIIIGLPYSNSYNLEANIGWRYLFGFGTTSISLFSTSLAFSILLIFTGLVSGTSFYLARHNEEKN
ncbi:MAG: hypothetical protein M1535_02555 [Candidatus Thermoplasmatota archaeon]|jgi:hypothetical protein|nr:hypothetical protein [Candidatus Thermoplasmatota archaeon]